MGHSPLHLTDRDFDAYAPEKATSNAYSRPRLEVKQRALAWARGVVARLAEVGISVDVHGSDEHPTLRNKKRVDHQWVFFWRDAAARDELDRLLDRGRSMASVIDDPSPYHRHAFLGLRLDAAAVEVCFATHPEAQVDVDNLRALLAEGALTDELLRRLRALPDEFTVGTTADDRVAAGSATPETLRSLMERAAGGQVPLWIGWSVKRETAVEHSELLDEQLSDALVALAPLYRLVAWSRDNDHVALDRRIRSAEEERARTHAEAEAQTEKWRAEQAEARRRSQEEALARADEARKGTAPPPARAPSTRPKPAGEVGPKSRPTLDSLFGPKPEAKSKPAPAKEAVKPKAEHAEPKHAAPAHHVHKIPVATAEPKSGLDRGGRVRVRTGPFAEKVGVISELDGKGGARVMLGLLSARFDLLNLEAVIEGRPERPALQSSHRKPIAARDKARG